MKFGFQYFGFALFSAAILVAESKIVYLNGTEIPHDKRKPNNVTTSVPAQKWFSVFNPRNISNHSGTQQKINSLTINRKNEAEATEDTVKDAENDHLSNGTMATRDTTVLSSLRGIFSDLGPILTILSTILGIFLIFVLIESPLSPLPVPPLPYPPIGPFPPTNIYPFGIPPTTNHYGIRYAEPTSHGSYRIPRNMQILNESESLENMIEKVIEKIVPSSYEDFFAPKKQDWSQQLVQSIKNFFINLSTIVENESTELLQEIAESVAKGH